MFTDHDLRDTSALLVFEKLLYASKSRAVRIADTNNLLVVVEVYSTSSNQGIPQIPVPFSELLHHHNFETSRFHFQTSDRSFIPRLPSGSLAVLFLTVISPHFPLLFSAPHRPSLLP